MTEFTNTETPWFSHGGTIYCIDPKEADSALLDASVIAYTQDRDYIHCSMKTSTLNAELIVKACNGWNDIEALRLRIAELEGKITK